MLEKIKKHWKLIFATLTFLILAIFAGAFVAFFTKNVNSERLLAALQYIESGAIPDESPEFAMKADLMQGGPETKLKLGAYKNVSTHDGVHYDTVLLLKDNAEFEFAMNVGNQQLHKTYQYSGRWWVEGQVFKTVLVEGDLFLASPKGRDRATPMREIIISSEENSMVLQAHYNSTPVKFELVEKGVEK